MSLRLTWLLLHPPNGGFEPGYFEVNRATVKLRNRMNQTLKRRLIIAGLTSIHWVATVLVSFSMFGMVLRRHHYGLSTSEAQQENLFGILSQISEFPLMSLARYLLGSAAINLTPLLWFANSLLWALVLYTLTTFAVKKIRRRPKRE